MSQQYASEFPLLRLYGLYAASILGDGNCLFNALSDQMYGFQDKHDVIRARTIDYMRQHSDFFKQFMTCYPGGGVRRNPKRKTAGKSFDAAGPSLEEIDRAFEGHLASMAKGGTWGDNMEIVAFSSAFNVNVKIYQRDNAYMVAANGGEDEKTVCHIAYHDWEHYSSIRNVNGPHQGLPHVKQEAPSSADLQQAQVQLQNNTDIPQYKVDIVTKSLPFLVDPQAVIKTLEQCHGNVNNAVDKLLEADEQRSVSSQQSSGIDREFDSSDEPSSGPNKKQDRRLSRASRTVLKLKQDQRKQNIAMKLDSYGGSLDSLLSIPFGSDAVMQPKRHSIITDSDEDSIFEPLKDGETSSDSEYSTPSSVVAPLPSSSTTTGLKIRLTPAVAKPATVNNNPPPKRLVAAREAKANKKLAQKAAAKQRKQAVANAHAKKSQHVSESSQATLTKGITGLQTLYI